MSRLAKLQEAAYSCILEIMAKKTPQAVSEYLSDIGSKGGAAKVPKGFSMMDPARRAALAKKAAAKRWPKKPKKAARKA